MRDEEDSNTQEFQCFPLWNLKFERHTLTQVLLTPPIGLKLRELIKEKFGFNCLPLTHTDKYRQATFVDIDNVFGKGTNAMMSITGVDKSHAMFVMKNPLLYLTTHHQMLMNDDFQVIDKEITVF